MRIRLAGQIALLAGIAIPLAGCHSSAYSDINEPSGASTTPSSVGQTQPAPQSNWQPGSNPATAGRAGQASEAQLAQQPQPAAQTQTAQTQTQAAQPATGNEVVIPLHEETVQVGKRTVPAGQVTIHKRVTTQTVQEPVQLRTETVDISREPAGAAAPPTASTQGAQQPFQDSTITIPLNKEEPIVQKNTVVSGEIVARKNPQTQQQMVQSQVRRENIQVEKSPDAQNVVINENVRSGLQPITEAAGAQTGMAAMAQNPQQFVQQAWQQNQLEIQLGQLAQQKAQSDDVKKLGQHLVQGHQQLNDKLTQLAGQKNIQLPSKLDQKYQATLDRFQNLSGADFDQQFTTEQVNLHRNAVQLFQQASTQNTDNDVKTFAQNSIPSLREHLQMAQSQMSGSQAAGAQSGQSGQSTQPGQSQSGSSDQSQPQSDQSTQPQQQQDSSGSQQ